MKDITAFIYILFSQGQRKFPGLREKNKEVQVCFKDTASVSGKYPLEISLSGVCLVHYTNQLVSNSRQKKNCNERERGGKGSNGSCFKLYISHWKASLCLSVAEWCLDCRCRSVNTGFHVGVGNRLWVLAPAAYMSYLWCESW